MWVYQSTNQPTTLRTPHPPDDAHARDALRHLPHPVIACGPPPVQGGERLLLCLFMVWLVVCETVVVFVVL